ncbi:MAG: hypothetical protein WBW53_19670 [Terriglobales bacterium]
MPIPVVSAEHVGPAAIREKGTSTMPQLRGFVNKYFYFLMSLLFATLVVWGFSRTVNQNLFHANPPRPYLLWIHGAAFATWIAFFITQSTLVRIRNVSWHRSFGWFGAGLATVMVPLGITIAIIMARFDTVRLRRCISLNPVLRHDRLRRVHRAGHLLEEKARIPSSAHVHRNRRAHGRTHRPL